MQIKGTITEVVFRNNENGYTIAKIETEDGEITATGKFPIVGSGEQVSLEGENVMHARYGFQFRADFVKVYEPTTREQIVKYLSSGLISGVGPVTANSIVEVFGERTLEVIASSPKELSKVRGVSEKKAGQISAIYNDIKRMQEAVMFLQKYDISINMAVKIYDRYKSKTESVLTRNPYILVEEIDGIGFRTADKIAIKMGIDADSEFRIRAGIVHLLRENAERSGSTILLQEKLLLGVCELLSIERESKKVSLDKVVVEMILQNIIKEHVDDEGEIFIALTSNYNMENFIATKIVSLSHSWRDEERDVSQNIADYENKVGFSLHRGQREAIELAINSGVVVITGGPGTGKTTIINAINSIFKGMGKKTLLLAPTGRAAKRLSESTGEEAKTIHRAIDLNFKGKSFESAFRTSTDIGADVLIVDEASMIDVYVMYNLLRATPNGTRLIIVGDKDQLPSVGAGNILDDLIKSGVVDVVYLSEIFRQAHESMIITSAHEINRGNAPDLSQKEGDFFFTQISSQERGIEEIVELVSTRLPKFLEVGSERIQVVAPTKSGLCGVENINTRLQQKLNHEAFGKQSIEASSRLFRVGDRVMQTVNNYDQEWTKGSERGSGVFNGDMGIIDEINPVSSEVSVLFEDGRQCFYSIAELDELVLSYAITIHKSQGSEFDAVVIPIFGGNPMLFNRNLLYTAVTRAKKLVVLLGSREDILRMVKNNYLAKRNTLLGKFLLAEEEKYKKLFC